MASAGAPPAPRARAQQQPRRPLFNSETVASLAVAAFVLFQVLRAESVSVDEGDGLCVLRSALLLIL